MSSTYLSNIQEFYLDFSFLFSLPGFGIKVLLANGLNTEAIALPGTINIKTTACRKLSVVVYATQQNQHFERGAIFRFFLLVLYPINIINNILNASGKMVGK